MMKLAFVNSELDRCAHLRKDEVALLAMRSSATSRLVETSGDFVRMTDEKCFRTPGDIATDTIFLGLDSEGVAWFAGTAQGEEELPPLLMPLLMPLRQIMLDGALPNSHLSILAQARSMVHWHQSHGYCAKCGAKSEMRDAGYSRHCVDCSTDHFPRTDPVVIMAVKRGEQFLLGRQAAWPAEMFSALAGFMEPRETIEQAVRREVMEETGIAVGEVSYQMSQPWPFPSSLMIGVVGEAVSEKITIDKLELEDARWFSRDDLSLMLKQEHPQGLWAARPYAIAHYILSAAVKL